VFGEVKSVVGCRGVGLLFIVYRLSFIVVFGHDGVMDVTGVMNVTNVMNVMNVTG